MQPREFKKKILARARDVVVSASARTSWTYSCAWRRATERYGALLVNNTAAAVVDDARPLLLLPPPPVPRHGRRAASAHPPTRRPAVHDTSLLPPRAYTNAQNAHAHTPGYNYTVYNIYSTSRPRPAASPGRPSPSAHRTVAISYSPRTAPPPLPPPLTPRSYRYYIILLTRLLPHHYPTATAAL